MLPYPTIADSSPATTLDSAQDYRHATISTGPGPFAFGALDTSKSAIHESPALPLRLALETYEVGKGMGTKESLDDDYNRSQQRDFRQSTNS